LGALVATLLLGGALATPVQAQLVGLYRFQDAVDPGIDSSLMGNDLTAFGGWSFDPAGRFGQGLALNGTNGVLAVSDGMGGIDDDALPAGFPINGSSYTLAAWVKTTVIANPQGDQMGIIGWGAYGSPGRVQALRLKSDGVLVGAGVRHYWWGNDLDFNDTFTVDLSDGAFHHVAATYDAAGNLRQIYVDGQVVAFDNPGRAHVRTGDFRIGRTCSICGQGEYFQGTLSDVAIFSQSLTQAQIQTIMSGDFSGFGVPST
jgi:hypothetical protein